MHLAHDPFPQVTFASEEKATVGDVADVDAHQLKNYCKMRMRQYISSEPSAHFTEADIEHVGKAFAYSALRLPSMMRFELLNEYADRPEPITRGAIEHLATKWDSGYSPDELRKAKPVPPLRYKTGELDLSRVH
jgi:hypothetical protein